MHLAHPDTFADFITDKGRCSDGRYHIDASVHHSELGVRCLKLMKMKLKKNICSLDWYSMNSDITDLPARRERYIGATLSYACSSWAKHLRSSSKASASSLSAIQSVNEFFAHHLLSWLEVLSIEGNFHIAIYSLHDVRSWLTDVSVFLSLHFSVIAYSILRVLINLYWRWSTIARGLFYGPLMVWSSPRWSYITPHYTGLLHHHP